MSIFFIFSIVAINLLRRLPVRIDEQLGQCSRNDLPRQAEPVLQPADAFWSKLSEVAKRAWSDLVHCFASLLVAIPLR